MSNIPENIIKLIEAEYPIEVDNITHRTINRICQSAAAFGYQLAQEQNEKWVSVDDRLPEVYKSVLAYRPQKEEIIICCLDHEGNWTIDDFLNSIVTVTHWLPLPSPPQQIVITSKEKK